MSDEHTEKRLSSLYPPFAEKVRAVIAALAGQGMEFRVVQGLRTFAEQDALFAQGRSRPGGVVTRARGGYSNHNYGAAADLCLFVQGIPDWNNNLAFMQLGIAAANAGLKWGGDWGKFVDKPHIEMLALTLAECLAIYKKGQLPAVWAAFDAKLGAQPTPETPPEVVEAAAEGVSEPTAERAPVAEMAAAAEIPVEPVPPPSAKKPQKSAVVLRREKSAKKTKK